MSEHDEWYEFEDEDAIVLEALAQMQAHDGDDEFDEALRDAFAAVAQEALALKERRMQREAAFAWADEQAQIAVEQRHARKEAERRDRARREAEDARRQEARERVRRDEARREAKRRRHREARNRVQREQQAQVQREREARLPAERRSRARQRRSECSGRRSHQDAEPVTRKPPLTGADLAAWRRQDGLNQQAAALRLGVSQGTISKAERRGAKPLGPALQVALAKEV